MTSQWPPKLSCLVIIPTGAFHFRFAVFEDIAHTVEWWAIERDARYSTAQLLPDFHESKTGGVLARVLGKPRD
jgi:hypothetical protein